MVAVHVLPSRASRHVDDGDLVLTNGRTTVLADIPGNNWPQVRLDRLTDAVQENMDHRQRIDKKVYC